MRRLCTTLQMHSCTAIMLIFSICQLETRRSCKACEEMVASKRNFSSSAPFPLWLRAGGKKIDSERAKWSKDAEDRDKWHVR